MYPVKDVTFGHTEKGKLVRFAVKPRGRQMLLQRFRDGLPMISDIVPVFQPKGRQPIAIAPEEIDWTDSDITPASTWTWPWPDAECPPHDPATCAACKREIVP